MAWIFSLTVECGRSPEAATRLGATLRASLESPMRVWCFADSAGASCISLSPEGLTPSSSHYEAGIKRWTERLRNALGAYRGEFHFGIVGVEADNVRTWEELVEDIRDQGLFSGVILHRDQYEQLGAPRGFSRLDQHYSST